MPWNDPNQPITNADGTVTHTPMSVRKALRIDAMTEAEAEKVLRSWGETEDQVSEALRVGRLYRGEPITP